MESIKRNLQKVVMIESESGNEVVFDISKRARQVFLPNFSDKITCSFIYDSDDEQFKCKDLEELNTCIKQQSENTNIFFEQSIMDVPPITYCDITEKLLLSSEEITKSILSSDTQGVLAFFGIRKIKFSFDHKFGNNPINKAEFRVIKANGESIDDKLIFSTDTPSSLIGDSPSVIIDLDTDKLGHLFERDAFKQLEYLRLACRFSIETTTNDNNTVTFRYPVELSLVNTYSDVFRGQSDYAASIDFGTTSTCVAIKKPEGNELLTIAASNGDVNAYENPTNLMLFDWDTLYAEWINSQALLPILYKGSNGENSEWLNKKRDTPVTFDFGYTVKDELGNELPDRKTINAILTLLKMLPYRIIHENRKLQFNPFNDKDKFIYIVTSPEEQDEQHFDPVAFYGYLIGRMINDRSKQKYIHTKFQVTSPVKFNDEIKASINRSLLHGLRRTVPKPLQDEVSIEMKYCEPVAFIGAICGTDYLKVNDNETVKFAVYDFGGGTLDFSFGEVICNDDGETTIDVKMVGGDETIGGESIIERLTFQIYLHNIEKVKKNQIPIEKPIYEELPDMLDKRLIISSPYSTANTNILNYRISRAIFEGRPVENSYKINLYDLNGKDQNIEISIDKDELNAYVEKIVRETVKTFINEIDSAFGISSPEDRREIKVFLAGNSSKNKYVMQVMNEELRGCEISRPDDTETNINAGVTSDVKASQTQSKRTRRVRSNAETQQSEPSADTQENSNNIADPAEESIPLSVQPERIVNSSVNKRYAITSKTAVALGQLSLDNFIVRIDNESFKLNIGILKMGSREFKTKIQKGCTSKNWVKFKSVTGGKVRIYYSESAFVDGKDSTTEYTERTGNNGETMFVRMKDQYVIEYCIGNYEADSIPDNAEIQEIDFTQYLSKGV